MSLVEALLERGVRLRSYAEGRHLTLCPKCSAERRKAQEPCLSVLIDEKGFVLRCHHCGWRDGWLERRSDSLNAKQIGGARRMPIATPDIRRLDETARGWLAERKLTPEIAERFGLWSEHGGLAFPFIDAPGQAPFNVKYRRFPKSFSLSAGAKLSYFGLQFLEPLPDQLVIVEGEADALACAEAGIVAISVPNGAPAKITGDAKTLAYIGETWERFKDVKRIVLAVDGDAAGTVLRDELARRYGRERCWFVAWPAPHKDAGDVLIAMGPAALADVIRSAQPFPVKFLTRMADYADAIMDLYERGTAKGLATGFPSLDAFYTIRPGELTVVTGYPGMGKSEFVDQLLVNLCHGNEHAAAICSFENPVVEHGVKWIEKLVGLPFFAGPGKPRASVAEISDAIDWLDAHFFPIRLGEESPTIDHILEAARGAVGRYGVRYLVIDPYNELARPADLNLVTETEYISQILGRLTRFAKAHGVHVFFIAHPRKPHIPEDNKKEIGPPSLFAISGSQNWMNKADVGLVVHRPSIYATAVEILVKKVRFKATGKPGAATLQYDAETGIYFEESDFDRETRSIA